MARIKDYELDNTITSGDKVLGTDINGDGTKNYEIGELKDFFNSGIDITVPVPPHYFSVTNGDSTDVEPALVRQDYTQLAVDVSFYPSNVPDIGEHDNINNGAFSLIADGAAWYFQVEEYTAKYRISSFVGKKLVGVWGAGVTELSFTVDSIRKNEAEINGVTKELDYIITDIDDVNPKRIFRFNITQENPTDWSELTEVNPAYRELHVRAEDNDNETLELATVYFQGDVDFQNVHIDNLDADFITFNEPSDPAVAREGIRFGGNDESIYTELVLDPSTGNLLLEGFNSTFTVEAPVMTDDALFVGGDTTLNSTLEVRGRADFADEVYFESDVSVLNASHLDFKIHESRIVDVDNFENVIISKDGVYKRDYGNTNFPINYVIANEPTSRQDSNNNTVAPTNEGELRSVQIGDKYWTIPQAVSQVAQVLPGFGEGLTGPSDAIITGTFFYGNDKGTYAEWESTPSGQVTGQSIPEGDTAIVISTDQRAAMNTLWNNLDLAAQSGQRLFFIESTDSLPSDISQGDRVELTVYEVVSYLNATGAMNFSKVGEGIIFVSAPFFELQNIATDSNEETILVLDNNNHVRQKEFSDIAGIAATANYTDTNDPDSFGTLKQLTFEGDHAVTTNGTGGNVTVDVTGKIPIDNELKTAAFNATVWTTYLLDNIAADQTVTLPDSTNVDAGDVIRFVNLSDLDSDGAQINATAFWTVTAFSGDRIMKLPADSSDIVLNEATNVDFIWSGIAEVGWIIQ